MLRRLTHLGVDPSRPRRETKHIVLTNQIALFNIVVMTIGGVLSPLTHLLPEVVQVQVVGVALSIVGLALNAASLPTFASSVMLAGALAANVRIGMLEPPGAEHAGFFGLIALVALFVFPRARRAWSLLFVVLSALATLWLRDHVSTEAVPAPLEGFDVWSTGTGNLTVMLTILVFFGVRTLAEVERVEDELVEERKRNEAILKREVAHQVAERSRELGNVLASTDVTLDARRLSPGERFAERYKIVASLGAGGMGAVYEVERVTDGARLALKAVVGEVSGASAARFAREAEIGARVHHAHLVSIVDVGVSTGVPYLVMEIVRGGSLEGQRDKFGDVRWALPILRQIAEGLAALHEAGVVHRDLKPANVLLDGATAKISDFGISRFGSIDDASVDANANTMAATPKKSADLTATNMVMGTPLYMAPEGAKTAKALDASADVFAFGIIAYEMLTGRSPFAVPAFVLAMAEQPIPAPTTIDDARVPDALRALVAECLRGDPARRPRTRELRAAL